MRIGSWKYLEFYFSVKLIPFTTGSLCKTPFTIFAEENHTLSYLITNNYLRWLRIPLKNDLKSSLTLRLMVQNCKNTFATIWNKQAITFINEDQWKWVGYLKFIWLACKCWNNASGPSNISSDWLLYTIYTKNVTTVDSFIENIIGISK